MNSAKDIARDIDCESGIYHVSPKGLVHEGPLRLCSWCRALTDGDRGVFLSPSSPAAEPAHRHATVNHQRQGHIAPAAGIAAHIKARDTHNPDESGHTGGNRPAVPRHDEWSADFLRSIVFALLIFVAITGAVVVGIELARHIR